MTKKNYLIIGGSSGIGRALVDVLLDKGHVPYVWSRTVGDLAGLPGVVHCAVDVLQDDLPVAQLPDVLDGVVYCPGSIDLKPFRSLKSEHFQSAFDINVMGAVRCLQAVERPLKKATHAAVVLFSTVAVQRGMPFHTSVAAAKGAIEGLTRALAAEWAPQVRVNAIAPSLTDTPLAQKLLETEEKRKAAADRHPLQRVGTAAEVAMLAAYLLDETAGFITGQIIGIDGGKGSI